MSRLFFIGICVFGLIAIFIAAIFEFQRYKSGDSVLSQRQSRWRIISSVLWMLILGSLAYATLFLWPEADASRVMKLRFYRMILGAMALMIPALVLLALDVRFTVLAQKLSRLRFEADLEEIARQEINKLQSTKTRKTTAVEHSEEIT